MPKEGKVSFTQAQLEWLARRSGQESPQQQQGSLQSSQQQGSQPSNKSNNVSCVSGILGWYPRLPYAKPGAP